MKFALLQQLALSPRTDKVRVLAPGESFDWIVTERRSRLLPMALDFETKGVNWAPQPATLEDKETYPVGVALSDDRGSVYVPFYFPDGRPTGSYPRLMQLLKDERVPLLAHNVPFDGGWPRRDFGYHLNWLACTLATYKLCATEGELGQSWGLKSAMRDVLGWAETNESGIHTWLCENGHTRQVRNEPAAGFYPTGDGRWGSPDLGEMWRVPPEILGHYAALDADACWQLWTYALRPCLDRFHVLRDWVLTTYMPYMLLLMEQKARGMLVDRAALEAYQAELAAEVKVGLAAISNRPDVLPHLQRWNAEELARLAGEEPPRLLASAARPAPKRLTRKGEPTAAFLKWEKDQSTPSARWTAWQWKHSGLAAQAAQLQLFNWSSGKQKAWLFYESMRFPVLRRTESSQPATDEDALKGMGSLGAELIDLFAKQKVGQFCEQVLSLLTDSNTLHPSFRIPGTVTGRLSGAEPNIQQMPNDARFLACLKARPGYKLVTCDVVSLENYVLAELSRDPSLLQLYGPDARSGQCAYLYNASQLPIIGPRIRATGYDPHSATAEETARAKKECKAERTIGKLLTLSASYGASANKIHSILRTQGVNVSVEEVDEMLRGFWEIYKGLKEWEREELLRCWRRNGGWVLNGIGRPLGICEDKKKDIINMLGQSTGHDLLIKQLEFARKRLDAERIEWYPWVADLHDAIYLEVREDQAERALQILERDSFDDLNAWAGGLIRLKGEGAIGSSWGDFKAD